MPESFILLANNLILLLMQISKDQPPEVKKQLWEWYVKDIAWWRKFLNIDKD